MAIVWPPREAATASAIEADARARFEGVDTWVFDLDNTLYPADSDLWPKIDARITLFEHNVRLGLSIARELRRRLEKLSKEN